MQTLGTASIRRELQQPMDTATQSPFAPVVVGNAAKASWDLDGRNHITSSSTSTGARSAPSGGKRDRVAV